MHLRTSVAAALAAVATLIASGSAHSWVEQLSVIAPNGTFVGAPGYARGNMLRQGGANIDKAMVYLLPPDGRDPTQGISPSDTMCFPGHQQQATQTDGSPRLKAAPGDLVALRYQENGHVTLPQNQPGKPPNRGTVYVYGTTQSSPDDGFLDIFGKWNADGSGGNKKGKLLASFNFDDGQCYQVNGGQISTTRQKQFPHTANQLMGADMWCQNNLALPKDAPSGKPYTLYWVWDWPTASGTPGVPNGKNEVYTSCMDVDVQGAPNSAPVQFSKGQPADQAAVPGQLDAIKAGNPMNAGTSVNLIGQKVANGAMSSAPAPAPAPSAPAAPSNAAPAQPPAQPPAQQPQNSPAQVTVTKVVTSLVTPSSTQSTTIVTVPKSTVSVQPTPAISPQSTEPGVPQISLSNDFSGTATPASAATPSGSTAKPCKHKKRSRVFGRAVV